MACFSSLFWLLAWVFSSFHFRSSFKRAGNDVSELTYEVLPIWKLNCQGRGGTGVCWAWTGLEVLEVGGDGLHGVVRSAWLFFCDACEWRVVGWGGWEKKTGCMLVVSGELSGGNRVRHVEAMKL